MAEKNMVSVLSDLGISVSEFPSDVNASSVPYGLKQTPGGSSSPVDQEEVNDGMSFPLSSLDPPLPHDHAEDRKSGLVQYVNDGDAAYNGLDLHFSLAAKEAENSDSAQNGRQDHILHEKTAEGDDSDLTSHSFPLAHQRSEYEFSISDLVAQAAADIAACSSTDQPVSVSLHLSSAVESVPLSPPSPNNVAPEISPASIVHGGLDHNTHVESPQVAMKSLDDDHTDSVKESDAALTNDSIMEDLCASEVALHPDRPVVEPNVPDHAVVEPNAPLQSDSIMEDLPESEPASHPDDVVVETKAPFPSEVTVSDASEGLKGSLPSTPVVSTSEQAADAVVVSADTCPEPAPSLQFHSLAPGITDMPNSTTVTVKGSGEEGSFQFSSLDVQTAAMESKVLLLFSQTPDPKPDASNMKQDENVPPSHIPPLALNLQLEPSIDTKEKSGTPFRGQVNVAPEVLESQDKIDKPQISNVEFPLAVTGNDVNAVKSQLVSKEDRLKEQSEQKLAPFNPESLHLQTYPLPLATHEEVIKDKDLFMDTLGKFHAALGMKTTSPRMGGTSLDLHILYREVTIRGGLQQVIKERMWKDVKEAFNFPLTATNASFVLRKYYTNLLHHYEQVYFFRVQGLLVPPPVPLPAPSPVSQPVDNGVTPPSLVEDLSSRKRARGVDFAAAVGQNVSGAIDGKFEHGYLVTVVLGSEKLSGVLYSVPSDSCLPQFGTIHHAAMMGPVSMEIDSQEFVKTRKTYRKRDPNAPKLNRSGYNFFFKEHRARLKPLYPNQDKEISRLIGDMWNKLTDVQKKPYQEQGLRDKERYKREYEAYQNQLRGQAEHSNPGATPGQDEDVLTNSRNVEFNGAAFVPSHFPMSYEGTSQAAQ